jgi:hypothetical protein
MRFLWDKGSIDADSCQHRFKTTRVCLDDFCTYYALSKSCNCRVVQEVILANEYIIKSMPVQRDPAYVFQTRKNRERGPAGADARHGDADDHEGEVIPEGYGKDPQQCDFVGKARERGIEDEPRDGAGRCPLSLHVLILS